MITIYIPMYYKQIYPLPYPLPNPLPKCEAPRPCRRTILPVTEFFTIIAKQPNVAFTNPATRADETINSTQSCRARKMLSQGSSASCRSSNTAPTAQTLSILSTSAAKSSRFTILLPSPCRVYLKIIPMYLHLCKTFFRNFALSL